MKTLAEILKAHFEIELINEDFTFVNNAFCIETSVKELPKCYIIEFDFNCSDKKNMLHLNNGSWKATIEKDGYIYDVETN